MADLMRHTAVWEGGPGLPGYSQFYHSISDPVSASAQAGANAVREFFSHIVSLIPDEVTVTVDPIAQILNEATGVVSTEVTVGTAPAVVTGVYSGGWSRQVGILVEWATGTFVAGRRLRGRTYLVPLGGVGDSDGTLSTQTLAVVNDAIPWITGDSEDFRVWHRPVAGVGGSSATITSGIVRDKAAILRSRMV